MLWQFDQGRFGRAPSRFCPPLPHGQSLCSRTAWELPACVSASPYPVSQLSLLKKPLVKHQASRCGGLFAVVLESCESSRPLCCLCRGAVAAGRRGGSRILGQLGLLICFWSKLDARMAFPCTLYLPKHSVNDLSFHRITEQFGVEGT